MNTKYENKKIREGYTCIIGCDEVGRGCLAGPVVAGAVILDLIPSSYRSIPSNDGMGFNISDLSQIKDSKLLTPEKREKFEPLIKKHCLAWGIGLVEPEVIDEMNIHNATLLAMRKAVENVVQALGLPRKDNKQAKGLHYARTGDKMFLYVDGKFTIPGFDVEQEAVVSGDNKILSVAAASIIAKVYRDSLMKDLHQKYPVYDFAQHKGYGTLHHRSMIIKNGLCEIHRKSFCKNYTAVSKSV